MTEAETANQIAMWALYVSVGAVIVAIAAVAFSAWQAVTAHLARTRPQPASLVLPPAQPGQPRTLHNEGGSAAHSIRILVWGMPSTPQFRRDAVRKFARGKRPKWLGEPISGGEVRGSLAAGATATITGFGPRAEVFGPAISLGVEGATSGLDNLYSPGLAYWTDSRGKRRHAWVEIR